VTEIAAHRHDAPRLRGQCLALRTPLTVINGFLEIALAQPNLDESTRMAHLKLMTEQGHRMQHLIDDMLTLSRLESIDYPLRSEVLRAPAAGAHRRRRARAVGRQA
jgi:signal transduction histidine kinase